MLFLVKLHFLSLLLLGAFFKKALLGAFFENFTKFNQQKLLDKGVSISHPYQPPPKKTRSAIKIGGRVQQDSIWCRKEGPGMQLS